MLEFSRLRFYRNRVALSPREDDAIFREVEKGPLQALGSQRSSACRILVSAAMIHSCPSSGQSILSFLDLEPAWRVCGTSPAANGF